MTQAANLAGTGICRAWVNFVGATGTITSSFNVASVTRTAAGLYTITFTTAMPNANYVVCGMVQSSGVGNWITALNTTNPTTTSFYTLVGNGAALADSPITSYVVFSV